MSYHTVGYMVEGEIYCEKCIKRETTQVEIDFLNGNKREWEIDFWPVREKNGSTKKSSRGAVVMRATPHGPKNPRPRTFDGQEISTFSEYSYGETEGDAVYCECGEVLIEAYECTCRSCDMKMSGSLAQKLDCIGRYTYCEDCIQKLVEIKQIEARIGEMYRDVARITQGKRPRIDLGPSPYYKDALLRFPDILEELKKSDSPCEFREYIQAELEKFEYLAHRNGGPAQTIFNLLEKLDELTYLIEEISITVWWNELDDVEEMSQTVEHYNDHGW